MRSATPFTIAAALALLLAACMPPSQGPALDDVDPKVVFDLPANELEQLRFEMRGLGGEALVDARQGDCAVSGFELPGQEYRILGAGGPFAVAGGPDGVVDPGLVATPGQVSVQIRALDAFTLPQGPVTIVVLDDFDSGDGTTYRVDASAVQNALSTALAALPAGSDADARDAALADAASQLEASGQLSHGGLVVEHLLAVLRSLGGVERTVDDQTTEVTFNETDATVTVRSVDLGGGLQRVSDVRDRVAAAVAEVRANQQPVVVNMSFAAVPCDMRSGFAANRARFPTFESYLRALADIDLNRTLLEGRFDLRLTPAATAILMGAVITRPVADDALALYLGDQGRDPNVRYVAASGNYSLPYALVPAAWPEVLGVGSRDVAKNPLDAASVSSFSDRAEVVAGGAFFALAGLTDPQGAPSLPAFVYAGTSFASPAVAVLVASDLSGQPPLCGVEASGKPELAGPEDDTPLEVAYPARCAS